MMRPTIKTMIAYKILNPMSIAKSPKLDVNWLISQFVIDVIFSNEEWSRRKRTKKLIIQNYTLFSLWWFPRPICIVELKDFYFKKHFNQIPEYSQYSIWVLLSFFKFLSLFLLRIWFKYISWFGRDRFCFEERE